MTDHRTGPDLPAIPMMQLYQRETHNGPRLTGRLGEMVVTGFPAGTSPEGYQIWNLCVRARSPVSIERQKAKKGART